MITIGEVGAALDYLLQNLKHTTERSPVIQSAYKELLLLSNRFR